MQKSLRILAPLLVGLLYLSAVAQEHQPQAYPEAWARWLKKYAAKTPYGSHNKAVLDWKYDETVLREVIDGKVPKLGSQVPFRSEGKPISEKEIWTLPRRKLNPRDRDFVAVIRLERQLNIIQERTLTVVFVGQTHARDYFFQHPYDGTLYAEVPYDSKCLRGNTAFRKALAAHRKLGTLDAMANEFLEPETETWIPALASLIGLRDAPRREAHSPKNLLSDAVSLKGRFIVIGDLHAIDSVGIIDDLPSAKFLKEMGIEQVNVLWETVPHKKGGYSPEEVDRYVTLSGFLKRTNMEDLVRKNGGAPFLEELDKNDGQIYPVNAALARKTRVYQKDGIRVVHQGAELSDKDPVADKIREFGRMSSEISELMLKKLAEDPNFKEDKELEERIKEMLKLVREIDKLRK